MKKVLIFLLLCLVSGLITTLVGGDYVVDNQDYKIGEAIDSLNGVYVYYNGSTAHVSGRNVAEDGYNLGLKYQCVEFAKRYYYQHLNHKMPDSYGHAKDFFDNRLADGEMNVHRGLLQYRNNGKSKPEADDLIVFSAVPGEPFGHLAIVSAVYEKQMEIIQQNPLRGEGSRAVIGLENNGGGWVVADERVAGWLRKVD